MNHATHDNQIKCECQLRDLVKPIESYNEKFEELERDNRKKEEKINKLEEKTRKMDKKLMIGIKSLTGKSNTLAETLFWCMVRRKVRTNIRMLL